MKMHWCWAVLFSVPSAFAEVIDGPANVRDTPNGTVVISLNDRVKVENAGLADGWYHIDFPVYLERGDVFVDPDKSAVRAGVKLQNEEGDEIGATLATVKGELYEEDRKSGRYVFFIKGFTHEKNIRKESILEPQLLAAINSSGSLVIDDFKEHIATLGYDDWISRDGFDSYIYFNRPTIWPTPWPRAILFFHERKLIAVFHGGRIKTGRITEETRLRGDKMSYFGRVEPHVKKKFEDLYFPILEAAN